MIRARERDHRADRRRARDRCSGSSSAACSSTRVDFIVFSLPVFSLIVFALAAIFVGILAAIFPARRASRLNILEALQYE